MSIVSGLLVALLAVLPVGPGTPPGDNGPVVTMTAVNWGSPKTLLDAAKPVYEHIGTQTIVAVTMHGVIAGPYEATLATPDSYDGTQPAACEGVTGASGTLECDFTITVGGDVNDLDFSVKPEFGKPASVQGSIVGGAFIYSTAVQALDAGGTWRTLPIGGALTLPAAHLSALRYTVTNNGVVPFRATKACRGIVLAAHRTITCALAGEGPVLSLVGNRSIPMPIEDAAGYLADAAIDGTLAACFDGPRCR